METNEKVTAKDLQPKSGQLSVGLAIVSNEKKGKVGLDEVHIFEVEPREPAKWWFAEIEKIEVQEMKLRL